MSQIRVVVGSLEKFTTRLIQSLTLDLTANLIETTPRDTGWARANWVPNIGSSIDKTAGTRDLAEAGKIDTGPQQAGQASIARYRLDQGAIFISNNVPYITRLNEGSSRQAPSGFVQQQIFRAIRQNVGKVGR